MKTHTAHPSITLTLSFDFLTSGSLLPEALQSILSIRTYVYNPNRFPFRAQTYRYRKTQTSLKSLPMHTAAVADMGNKPAFCRLVYTMSFCVTERGFLQL